MPWVSELLLRYAFVLLDSCGKIFEAAGGEHGEFAWRQEEIGRQVLAFIECCEGGNRFGAQARA